MSETPKLPEAATPTPRVRRLNYRQPVPRAPNERVAFVLERAARFPGAIAITLLLVGLAWPFGSFLLNSSYFELKTLEVYGNERLTEATITAALAANADVEAGRNMLGLGIDAAESAVAAFPEVKSVKVTRAWPNTLMVEVRERSAKGIIATNNGSWVFDREGFVFAKTTSDDLRNGNLPLLSGFKGESLEVGRRVPQRAIEVVTRYREVFAAAGQAERLRVAEYHWDGETGLTLVKADGRRFVCGQRQPEEVGPIIEALETQDPGAQSINTAYLLADHYLSYTENNLDVVPVSTTR